MILFSSVAQSCLTLCDPMDCSMPDFLPCTSLSPEVCSNSCALSWWCHSTISSSVSLFSSCLQSFPTSGSFPMNWLFTSGGQSIGASASASVLPVNIQSWFLLGLTVWITLQSRDSWESSPTLHFDTQPSLLTFHMTTGKTIPLTIWTFVSEVMSLLFNMLLYYNSVLLQYLLLEKIHI